MLRIRFPLLLAAALAAPAPAAAQTWPVPADVASPEAVVAATYEAINRAPGGPFQWDRFRSLFRPDATLLPAVEQTGGALAGNLLLGGLVGGLVELQGSVVGPGGDLYVTAPLTV